MEECKELRIEAETFDKLRRDADIVLQRALGTMKEKESMDGKVTITIDIKLVPEFIPNYDPAIQGETRKILKPKFDNKVTSAINIKNEEKGSVNPETLLSVALVGFARLDAHVNGQSLFAYDGLEEDGDTSGVIR